MRRVQPSGWLARFAAAAVAFVCLSLPGDASAGRLTFPLELNEAGYFTTPIRVNGAAELPAIIDTAATIAMIESRAAARSGLTAPPPEEAKVQVFGLLGERTFPLVNLGSVSSESVRIFDVRTAYNDREQMPGGPLVIPAVAFGGDVLDFDFPAGRFSVYDGRPKGDASGTGRGPLRIEGGLLFADITINGVKGKALIDTGSPFSFINSKMAQVAKTQRDEEKSTLLQGATGGQMAVSVAAVKRFSMARFSVRRISMVVADPAMFDDLGLRDEPAMLLGLDLLSLFRVQIDRRRGYIFLTSRDDGLEMAVNFNARGSRIEP